MNIVITGASKGFGKALAEKFASNGHDLYICSRNAVALYKTVDDILTRFPGITIKAKPFDLSIKEQAQRIRSLGTGIWDSDRCLDQQCRTLHSRKCTQ